MKYLKLDVVNQRFEENNGNWLSCLECGRAELHMVHVRLNPVNMGQHERATPLGGLYCAQCSIKIMKEIADCIIQIMGLVK